MYPDNAAFTTRNYDIGDIKRVVILLAIREDLIGISFKKSNDPRVSGSAI